MRWLLVSLALTVGAAQSQETSNNKSVTQEQQKTEQGKSGADERTAFIEKPKPNSENKTGKQADSNASEKLKIDRQLVEYTGQLAAYTQSLSDYTKWLVIVTAILALVGFGQGYYLKRTVDAAREEFNSSHRPRIRVRHLVFSPPPQLDEAGYHAFKNGEAITIQLDAVNIGGSPANIIGSHCLIHTTHQRFRTLPMNWPYEGSSGNDFLPKQRLQPGQSVNGAHIHPDPWGSEVDEIRTLVYHGDDRDNWRLYVMGWVDYVDDRKVKRRTAFCRRYGSKNGLPARFVDGEDPEYEYED